MSSSAPASFSGPAHAAFLRLQKLAFQQQQGVSELLRTQNLSIPQYNVLRILRGASEGGLTCSGIGERLIVHDPDVTRLLDRLEKAGLVRRERQAKDRRVILCFITAQGLKILSSFDQPMSELHRQQFAALSADQLVQLNELITPLLSL